MQFLLGKTSLMLGVLLMLALEVARENVFMRLSWISVIALIGVSACSDAKTASEVAPELVSPSTYSNLSCRQLRAEAEMIRERTPALSAAVDKAYNDDKAMEAVAWILFWPAAIAIDGNDTESAQLSRAKGQLEAITYQMRSKGCKV